MKDWLPITVEHSWESDPSSGAVRVVMTADKSLRGFAQHPASFKSGYKLSLVLSGVVEAVLEEDGVDAR
jgi:hypothetical protein